MKKKGAWKKNLFWYLFGSIPLLVLICVVLFMTTVDDAIAEESLKIEASGKELAGQKPKGIGLTKKLTDQQKQLETTGNQLWETNYKRQLAANLFRWPIPPNARHAAVLLEYEAKHTRFGEELKPEEARADELLKLTDEDVYLASYKQLADAVAPTRFGNAGWQNVLRHVSDWENKRPDSPVAWLAIEDYWVQKALLEPVRIVNDSITRFHLMTQKVNKWVQANASDEAKLPEKDRTFANRTWMINLQVVEQGATRLLKAKLTNRTNRLQLLGIGKTMKLKIWLNDPAVSQPFDYKIEGELVKGNAELDVKLVPGQHAIPPSMDVRKITRVEQVLDELTVPVRLVQDVQLACVDHKRTGSVLLTPEFIPADTPSPTMATGAPGSVSPSAPPPMYPSSGNDPSGSPVKKSGTVEQVILPNRNRYVVCTPRLRRMAVGVVLVLDQAYMSDAEVAYANSPLRFQITQMQYSRFRDPLPITMPATTVAGNKIPSDFPSPVPNPTGTGGPITPSTVTVNQVTAGLIELGIYGIVSMYEQYDPKAAAAAAATVKSPANPTPTMPMPTPTPKPSPMPMPMPMPMPKMNDPFDP